MIWSLKNTYVYSNTFCVQPVEGKPHEREDVNLELMAMICTQR